MSLPHCHRLIHSPFRFNDPSSTCVHEFRPSYSASIARIKHRDAHRSLLSEFPTACSRIGANLRRRQCSRPFKATCLRQESQCDYELRDRSSPIICKRRTQEYQFKPKQKSSISGTRAARIDKRNQLFWYDRGLSTGRNAFLSARMDSLQRHCKLPSNTVNSRSQIPITDRGHCKTNRVGSRLRHSSAASLAIGYFITGTVLGSRSSVATAVNKRLTAEARNHVAETSSVTRQDNPGIREASLSFKSGLKIGGFEESKASPGATSLDEHYLSSNDGANKLRKVNMQVIGKMEDISRWWKVLHDVYREDVTNWGFGTNPIFTVHESPDGRIERVTVDEKEIQRRAGVEPFLSLHADEANKALAQQRIALARGIAKDIEMGQRQPKNNSAIFSVVKSMNKQGSQHKDRTIVSQIGSFTHTAAPVLRSAFLVGMTIYGFCVLWGACILLSKRQQKNIIEEEESAARFDKIRKFRSMITRPDESDGESMKASTQSSADNSEFVQKLEEVREMAKRLCSGGDGSQTLVESAGRRDLITSGENRLGSLPMGLRAEDGGVTNVVDIESESSVNIDKSNMEEMNVDYSCGKVDDKDKIKVQALVVEDGSNALQMNTESASVIVERQKVVGNNAFEESALIENGSIGKGPSKPSLRVKPRIILSPEEARITISCRRVRQTSTNNHHSESSGSQNVQTRKTIPRRRNGQISDDNIENRLKEHPSAEESSANDNLYNGHDVITRLNGSSNSVQSGYFNGFMQKNQGQTLDLQNEGQNESGKNQKEVESWVSNISVTENEEAKNRVEEEPVWMRHKALREVVFKVQQNEEAGREPFSGLSPDEEMLLLEGISGRIKMEQDRETKLVERYGHDGIGMDDSTCGKDLKKAGGSPVSTRRPNIIDGIRMDDSACWKDLKKAGGSPLSNERWKDLKKAGGSPLSNERLEEKRKQLKDHQSSKASLLSSTSQISDGVQDMELTETRESSGSNKYASGRSDPAVVGSGQPLRKEETFTNSKRWGKELQKKFDSERDPEVRKLMKEIGSDLDSWVTEEEVEEAGRLASEIEREEEEYGHQHFKSVHKKIKQQKERFGLEAVLNKYKEYQPEPEDTLWWLDLHCVLCVKAISKTENEGGLYSLDMSLDLEGAGNKQAKHVIGFQDRKDVMSFCYLLQDESESKFANVEVCPFSPKQLYKFAKMEGFEVTVLKQGQLQIKVGQSLDEVEEKILEIGKNVSLQRLENEQSIDVDSILDQGFGL